MIEGSSGATSHGEAIAIVDASFPATAIARRLITLPGVDAPRVLTAVLSVLPIDDFDLDPVVIMQVVGDTIAVPEPVREFGAILAQRRISMPTARERHAFYKATAQAFVIVQTGERRLYGNILLRKGVIPL
jgi:L-fucose mutarotase